MRKNDLIEINSSQEIPDGFGGHISTADELVPVAAIVSLKYDENQSKPGLGYYRFGTFIVDKGVLSVGDKVKYDEATFNITRRVHYKHSFLEAFIGYED